MIAQAVHVAMWSGPRNLSTAMMRSWGNRPDTTVCDEPLYAHYLQVTGKPHPGAEEVIASQDTDWRKVVEQLTGTPPEGKRVYFQKHMTHHLLPQIDRGWLGKLRHFFLIRDPREVITSYVAKHESPALEDIGYLQQWDIYNYVKSTSGQAPPIVDARDIQENPREVLSKLCTALGLEFSENMLSWPPGLRATDGVWAKHWYPEAQNSTTFRPYQPKPTNIPPALEEVYQRALAVYEPMHAQRMR